MEPLTAITLLVAQYGIRQVVAALTGNQEMSALASEVFRQLSASEDRLSSDLARIEEQLHQALAQPYETAIGAGARGLLDVVATRDSPARREDLMQARERFRDATAAARSPLQRAIAERYLLLCAIALNRQDAAKTALGQLNYAATTAALEVDETVHNADRIARRYLEDHSQARGFGRDRRLAERAEGIRREASEAAQLVMNLLSEAALFGQTLGQPQPPAISSVPLEQHSSTSEQPLWHVVPSSPGPVRIGSFVVSWDQCEPSGSVWQRSPIAPGGPQYFINVQADIKIEADLPLPRPVPLKLWGSDNTPGRSFWQRLSSGGVLPEGERLRRVEATVSTRADPDGKITETSSVCVGPFKVFRRS